MSNLYNSNELTLMLCLTESRPLILCSEHFAECDFVNFMAEYQMRFAQSGICRSVHRVTDLEKNPVRISKDEADSKREA